MCDLDVASRFSVLKYGDTIADIREGVNAGVWSVGVIMGSNELGLTEEETRTLPMGELKCRMAKVRDPVCMPLVLIMWWTRLPNCRC